MRTAAAPLVILGVILSLTLLAPVIATDPMRTDTEAQSVPPGHNWAHPLGTDRFGRDVLSRALYGGQHTLGIAISATLIAVVGGLLLGTAALSGRTSDVIVSTLLNALLAIPGLMIAFVVVTLLGHGEASLALATGLAQIAPYARVVRGVSQTVKAAMYVEAADALGATRSHVLLYHVLPNAATTLFAYGAATFSYCILNGAALSFLGLGATPGSPDWGVMLADGRAGFRTVWWVSLVPGVLITLTVCAVNRLSGAMAERR